MRSPAIFSIPNPWARTSSVEPGTTTPLTDTLCEILTGSSKGTFNKKVGLNWQNKYWLIKILKQLLLILYIQRVCCTFMIKVYPNPIKTCEITYLENNTNFYMQDATTFLMTFPKHKIPQLEEVCLRQLMQVLKSCLLVMTPGVPSSPDSRHPTCLICPFLKCLVV